MLFFFGKFAVYKMLNHSKHKCKYCLSFIWHKFNKCVLNALHLSILFSIESIWAWFQSLMYMYTKSAYSLMGFDVPSHAYDRFSQLVLLIDNLCFGILFKHSIFELTLEFRIACLTLSLLTEVSSLEISPAPVLCQDVNTTT